jgi:hypothetical protein
MMAVERKMVKRGMEVKPKMTTKFRAQSTDPMLLKSAFSVNLDISQPS